jgi:hypothetical protein
MDIRAREMSLALLVSASLLAGCGGSAKGPLQAQAPSTIQTIALQPEAIPIERRPDGH